MKLYLVPTPVGNLADITLRALDTLREVDLILAEDTRTTAVLLRHYDITTPLQSYHIFNEHQIVERIVERMQGGTSVAVVTDAGTPGISDPGFLLVRQAVRAGIEVECLPGATAVIPATVMSGLPCDRFVFEGFLPHKKGRRTRLLMLARETRTIVLYESPHRLQRFLTELVEYMGAEREVAVCREISKVHAETVRGTAQEVCAHYSQGEVRGEIVVVIAGCDSNEPEANNPSDNAPSAKRSKAHRNKYSDEE